jgi:ubiquinone/menaquinone biosynthesis C-methylase UbiE
MDENTYQQIASQLRKPEGEEGIKTGEWMNRGNELMNKLAIATLQASPNDHILEIGMGNGFFVKNIVSVHESIKYVGCDFSDLMTKEAEKNNLVWIGKNQAQFRMGDVNQLPFEDARFNKILTINTVYFLGRFEQSTFGN